MRVEIEEVMFEEKDIIIIDEKKKYIEIEGVLWMVDYVKSYKKKVIIIRNDRDMLKQEK